jgi:hypothetical protein
MCVKNVEADAWQEGKDITTAKAEIGVGGKQRIRKQ